MYTLLIFIIFLLIVYILYSENKFSVLRDKYKALGSTHIFLVMYLTADDKNPNKIEQCLWKIHEKSYNQDPEDGYYKLWGNLSSSFNVDFEEEQDKKRTMINKIARSIFEQRKRNAFKYWI